MVLSQYLQTEVVSDVASHVATEEAAMDIHVNLVIDRLTSVHFVTND